MATVYLARDLKHDRFVALKVLHADLAAALGGERFLREIRLAARLQHPHVLSVHDSGDAAGQLWFTMPYVEGESLRARLERERQLSVADALRIAREAAEALDYAHRHGVIHRDVKPENILLTEGHSLLADFGIARALQGSDRLTETGMAVGTPAYMSPEQASGEHALDARTDVYALGCVLYEMLAGHPPFLGSTAREIVARHSLDPVPPLRASRPDLPAAVERAAFKALAKTPADRFPTAGAFGDALTAAPAVPPSRWCARRPARRQPGSSERSAHRRHGWLSALGRGVRARHQGRVRGAGRHLAVHRTRPPGYARGSEQHPPGATLDGESGSARPVLEGPLLLRAADRAGPAAPECRLLRAGGAGRLSVRLRLLRLERCFQRPGDLGLRRPTRRLLPGEGGRAAGPAARQHSRRSAHLARDDQA